MDDQSQAASAPVRKSTTSSVPPSPASTKTTPAQSRQTTQDTNASQPPSKSPSLSVHPAASVSEAGGVVAADTTKEPSPISRTASPPRAVSPVAKASNSTDSGEVDHLRKQISQLKDELGEKDHLIRKLEVEVEKLKTNAKKARDALGL